jgi:DNA-binding response OmpR family regulator
MHPSRVPSPSGPPPARPEGASILIVIDDPDLAATCLRFLAQLGHAPRVEPDSRAAARLITERWPRLVLLDLERLDEEDGQGLLARARAPGGPAVLCTGRASEASRRRALAAGAVTYLSKPFALAALATAVTRALNRHGPVAEA